MIKNKNVHYLQRRLEFIENSKKNKSYTCIFSGEPLGSNPDIHYLIGKNRDLLLESNHFALAKRKWKLAWNKSSIHSLMKQKWWDEFLKRVKDRNPNTYYLVIKQIEERKLKE